MLVSRYEDSDLAGRRDGYVEITCSDTKCFKSWSDAELANVVDMLGVANTRVSVGAMQKGTFLELEKSTGLNCNPLGMIADASLRPYVNPIGVMTYDWVHNMLQDGTFTAEAHLFLKSCEPLGVTRAHIHDFLKDEGWQFPMFSKGKAKQLHRVFDTHRVSSTEPDKIKCSCAEMLGLYGLLRHFFETRVGDRPEVRAEHISFKAACHVIDLILQAKRCIARPAEAAAQLEAAASAQLRLHILAYGTQHIKPKHHWLLDVPAQMERDGCVLDAFIIERTHLMVKGIAENVKNTHDFERTVMRGVTTLAFQSGAAATYGDSLLGKVAALPGYPNVQIADKMAIFTMQVAIDDVILRGEAAGIVVACACEGGLLYAIVQTMLRVARVSSHASAFQPTGGHEVWLASEVEHSIAWYGRPDGSYVVIRT
jgi:hypothetical protein